MDATNPTTNNPFETSFDDPSPRDEWEDWEDEGTAMPKAATGQAGLLVDVSDETTERSQKATTTTHPGTRNTQHRYSVQKPIRFKSKGRQKAQNAKAGIKVVTDMSNFGRQAPPQQQMRAAGPAAYDDKKGKFVDADALLALEGEPTSASIGSFSWLKRKPKNMQGNKTGKKPVRDPSSDLSPDSRPIVIGIAVPSDDLSEHQVSPYTAVLETPLNGQNYPRRPDAGNGNGTIPTPQQQQRSVWSPDTEASESPYNGTRPASSMYSQPSTYGAPAGTSNVPPVPALPATFKFKQTVGLAEPDDDDVGTPCTLFEEDGSPTVTRKSYKPKAVTVSPESATSRSNGWWDHITTPFMQQTNPFKQQPQDTASSSSTAPQEWWSGTSEKREPSSKASGLTIITPAALEQQRTAQSTAASSSPASSNRPETRSEKAQILLEENQTPNEEPPPYSPPKKFEQVKYGAVLPPVHVASSQSIPSPGPMTPGLPGTMTSQGAIHLAEIPLTPPALRTVPAAVLPDRPVGSFVPGDHFLGAPGRFNKAERQRRRHEKEETVARKAGGFWRGRGILPTNGCFGRPGREGRKRRRVCLGILGGVIGAIVLTVVLVVVLTRRTQPEQSQETSIWLNLTDFPPMPTGVLTVAGPDNSESVSGCVSLTATTAWSCSLPKEEHDSVAPYAPNQPEFIFQIQYDNDTRALWKITDEGEQPDAERRSIVTAPGFAPDPEPPSIAEMRFLGNTTDHIEADEKAGEPTPFYISLLTSVNDTVGPNMLSRRQGFNNAIDGAPENGTSTWNISDNLPAPELNGDGTGAPTRLFPLPVQQPVRLFDRGLPTEHYGFYTHFDKKIYLKDSLEVNPNDEDGGSLLTDATSLVTFAESRFLVKMWTRMENTTQLLGNGTAQDTDGPSVSSMPGTMPYPVTLGEDGHGGDWTKKTDYVYGVLDNQSINRTDAKLVLSDRGFGGTLINDKAGDPDLSLGGVDGGTGGCKCEWVNFKSLNKS